jgi:hypothetical protein
VLYKACEGVIAELGLPYVRLPDPRRSAAALLLEQEESLKMVAERPGHSAIRATADSLSARLVRAAAAHDGAAGRRVPSPRDLDATVEPESRVDLAE